ncbi:MAG TPA: hypothetical protein PK530_15650 [Anaerolineales bacterium]|nr:hypothetical protein [Anaerolineales bacterium]
MSEITNILLLALLIGICLIAYFSVLQTLFPVRIERARFIAETSPTRAFFVGLVNFLFFGAICLVSLTLGEKVHGIFLIPGLIVLAVLLFALSLGLTGIVQLAGNRLFPEKSPFARTAWGTGIVYLACLTPFVGWFGLFIYVGLLGIGAFILTFFQPKTLPAE